LRADEGSWLMRSKPHPSKQMIDRARSLRRESTPPEQLLWLALRNGQIGDLRFRRQHPIGPYVVDFYCHSIGLVVEVDGMSHDGKASQDAVRTAFLEKQGIRALRVTNEDVMRDLDAVTREIARLAGVPWD
jgi:ATP-dependent DNA helicase RecQ